MPAEPPAPKPGGTIQSIGSDSSLPYLLVPCTQHVAIWCWYEGRLTCKHLICIMTNVFSSHMLHTLSFTRACLAVVHFHCCIHISTYNRPMVYHVLASCVHDPVKRTVAQRSAAQHSRRCTQHIYALYNQAQQEMHAPRTDMGHQPSPCILKNTSTLFS